MWWHSKNQRDNYATGCLLNYNSLKDHHKMTAIDLSKQEALEVDPKAIHQINFSGKFN